MTRFVERIKFVKCTIVVILTHACTYAGFRMLPGTDLHLANVHCCDYNHHCPCRFHRCQYLCHLQQLITTINHCYSLPQTPGRVSAVVSAPNAHCIWDLDITCVWWLVELDSAAAHHKTADKKTGLASLPWDKTGPHFQCPSETHLSCCPVCSVAPWKQQTSRNGWASLDTHNALHRVQPQPPVFPVGPIGSSDCLKPQIATNTMCNVVSYTYILNLQNYTAD